MMGSNNVSKSFLEPLASGRMWLDEGITQPMDKSIQTNKIKLIKA